MSFRNGVMIWAEIYVVVVGSINILSRHLGYIPLGHSKLAMDFSFSSPVIGSMMRAVVYFYYVLL